MAGASMKDIKLRIKSVESTKQITKAMELVASSTLRRARERVEQSRPYFTVLHEALSEISASNLELSSPYLRQEASPRICYVVIAGDRGLAGGYNANLFRELEEQSQGQDICVLPIGKKAVEYVQRRGIPVLSEDYTLAGGMQMSDCFRVAQLLAKGFREGSFGQVRMVYTNFVSMLTQQPGVLDLLPLNAKRPEKGGKARNLPLYEPDCESVYNAIVPEYLAGLVYGALCESVASELGARRTAMDAASKNAEEMIENLSLHYNRARQAAITQEITEIVAGAEA